MQLADDSGAGPITVRASEFSTDIISGDLLLAAVSDADARQANRSREQLAREWASSFEREVSRYRNEHSRSTII